MKIDAHQHFWRYTDDEFGWIESPDLRRDFLPQHIEAELESAGIDGSVLVQARESLEETRWNLELAESSNRILGVVGWVDWTAKDALAELETLPGREWLKGLRLGIQGKDVGLLEDECVLANLTACGDFGLACDLLVTSDQLEAVVGLVGSLPGQRFVLDHCGKPAITPGQFDLSWAGQIAILGRFPNVYCKVSGLATEVSGAAWTPQILDDYWQHVLSCFGPQRLMFGSDWPVCLGRVSYQDWLGIVLGWLSMESSINSASLLGGNAREFYKLQGY